MFRFIPTGMLDTTTDPQALPEQLAGKGIVSGAMQRCTNLSLDSPGKAETRKGSARLNASAMDETAAWAIIEMGGYRYTFSGTKIYRDESSIATGMTSARWSGVVYNAYNDTASSIFATNGTDRKRIQDSTVAEWGIEAPSAAPTVTGISYLTTASWEGTYYSPYKMFATAGSSDAANKYRIYPWEDFYTDFPNDHPETTTLSSYGTHAFDASGAAVATYQVKYTYCRKSSDTLMTESNPSPAGSVTQGNGRAVSWSASSDSQVTHVRIYRTLAGGATFYYDSEHAVGNLSAVLSTADAGLGLAVSEDHDRPPTGGTAVSGPTFNGFLFLLKENKLYYCKPNQPEYWPTDYYIEVGPPEAPLTGIDFYNAQPFVASRRELHLIQGTGADSFFPLPVKGAKGAVGDHAMAAAAGAGLWHVASDGIYQYAGGDDQRISDMQFRGIFLGITAGSVPGMATASVENCLLLHHKNLVWFAWPEAGSTYPDHVLVFNLLTKRAVHYDYGRAVRCWGIDHTNDRVLAADGDGYVWALESGTTDNGTAVSWQIETKDFTNRPGKVMPRSVKYDVETTSGTSTASVLLDGTAVQTHALSTANSRSTRKRLVAGGNGDRMSVRIAGSGVAAVREIFVE